MLYCFTIVAGLLAHPIQSAEKIEGMFCTEDGAKMLAIMQAPAEERMAFNARGQEVDDPAVVEFLEKREAAAKREEEIEKMLRKN